jgi:RNA polymerase sigma-70 factor (family 1)
MIIVTDIGNEELLLLLQQDGDEGFSIVYRQFWPSLYNSAYKRLRDKEKCQDVVQNVFTDLWHRRKKITINNLAAYLHTAVRFQVYKQSLKTPVSIDFYGVFEELLESPFTADESVLSSELSNLIELWIAALPTKRRKIFLMHYYENLSTKEIADKLNISQKTVQNQINTASTYIKNRFAHLIILATILSSLKN